MSPLDPTASRRVLLTGIVSSAGLVALSQFGCATTAAPCRTLASPPPPPPVAPKPLAPTPGLLAEDLRLLALPGEELTLVQRTVGGRGVLRTLARPLTQTEDLSVLERRLRASLASTKGVGIAAPQVGIGVRAILVMLGARPAVPGDQANPRVEFYLNPRIVERSDEITLDYEGCLSVAEVCGLVRRHRAVVVEHGLLGAKTSRTEAVGFDARIFQHEIDHLEGVLFVDRVEGALQPKERIRELREQLRKEHPELALAPCESAKALALL